MVLAQWFLVDTVIVFDDGGSFSVGRSDREPGQALASCESGVGDAIRGMQSSALTYRLSNG
jgi:hypothetical protein